MEIDLKKDIGDLYWVMYKNRTKCGKIRQISYYHFNSLIDDEVVIKCEYTLYDDDGINLGTFKEDCMFESKDALLQSL